MNPAQVQASNRQSLSKIVAEFKAQEPEGVVIAARCCGRIYIGRVPAVKCRTCEEPAKNVEIREDRDLDNLFA